MPVVKGVHNSMVFATTQDAQQLDPVSAFFAQYGMLIILVVLIVFMFWSSRRRAQKMKAEQENKQRAMVPGAKVLLQGGLYGTLVSFDAEDLSRPAVIALAPGVEVEVHSQAVLRVVDDEENGEPVESGVVDAAEADQPSVSSDDVTPGADDKPQG